MKTVLFSILTVTGLCAFGSANAGAPMPGYWAFNPERCPDLVEDRRDRIGSRIDEAYDRGPRDVIEDYADRRENARDEARTYCPASAFVWQGPAYRRGIHAARPSSIDFYHDRKARLHYRYGNHNKRIVVVRH